MTEKIHHNRATQVVGGKWREFPGEEVGPVGKTDHINGGIGITTYSKLVEGDDGNLINPANGEVFKPTKSGSGFFNKNKGVFVKPYYVEDGDDGKKS